MQGQVRLVAVGLGATVQVRNSLQEPKINEKVVHEYMTSVLYSTVDYASFLNTFTYFYRSGVCGNRKLELEYSTVISRLTESLLPY